MRDGDSGVILTGVTGFLGGEVLVRMLEFDQRPIYALVRAGSDEEADARLRQVLESLFGSAEPWLERVVAVPGDIARPRLGMAPDRRFWLTERVQRIVHCAATVSFTLGLEESRQINVEGTRRMLDLAELCHRDGGLDCFVHVSTAYVAGTRRGLFGEDDLDVGQGFRNAYERSKFEAELVVRERAQTLPVQVVRPSIVVGDSRTGWTPAFNVLYGPLRAFSSGAYPVIPARRDAPVDVVPVDYVADGIVALAGRPGATHHLVAGRWASSVGELIELASGYTRRRPPRTVPMSVYRGAIHPVLLRRGSERRRKALRRSEVFFPYFSMRVRYGDARSRDVLAPLGVEAPPLRSYFDRLMGFAQATEWGRRPVARHEAASMFTRRSGETVAPREALERAARARRLREALHRGRALRARDGLAPHHGRRSPIQ